MPVITARDFSPVTVSGPELSSFTVVVTEQQAGVSDNTRAILNMDNRPSQPIAADASPNAVGDLFNFLQIQLSGLIAHAFKTLHTAVHPHWLSSFFA